MSQQNNRKLVGFTGQPGSGRTALAKHFFSEHYYIDLSIRKPVRAMLHGLLPFDGEKLRLQEFRAKPNGRLNGRTPHDVLASLSAWLALTLGEQYLYERIAADLNRYLHTHYTVDDIDTTEDAQFIKSQGGVIVSLSPGAPVESELIDYRIPESITTAARAKFLESFLF